jgi:enoyl-CoA hydratase
MTDLAPSLSYRLDDAVAIVTMDDGKANAISPAVLEGLHALLDQAQAEARALLIEGRPGKFSAGFDLSVMTAGVEPMRGLVTQGAEFLARLYEFPLPTVAACSGHALAGGALMLLVSDVRIGALGPAKIGLNEVAIGMPLPIFCVEFARDRLTAAAFTRATMGAQVFDPQGAVLAGYLDAAVQPELLADEALAQAQALAQLSTGAYARTKAHARRATLELVRSTLADDIAGLTGPA